MKRFAAYLALAALVGGGGYYYFQAHPEALPQQGQLKQFEHLKQRVQDVATQAKERFTLPEASPAASPLTKFLQRVAPAKPAPATPTPPVNQVTLYLVNGGVVTGELVSETPQEVTLRFEYGDVGFRRAEIKRLVKGKEGTDDDNLTMPWETAQTDSPENR